MLMLRLTETECSPNPPSVRALSLGSTSESARCTRKGYERKGTYEAKSALV